jgi:hypothetical protein
VSILKFFILTALVSRVFAADSLSYSGRLVNADGSPVSGPVTLVFDLVYTNAPAVAVCSKTVAGVTLVNGVFSRKLDFTSGECGGSVWGAGLGSSDAGPGGAGGSGWCRVIWKT